MQPSINTTIFPDAYKRQDKNLLYSFYRSNEGNPLEAVKTMLKELYAVLPQNAYIANTCVTGYGEGLIKTAFRADLGEIETMAHYKADVYKRQD